MKIYKFNQEAKQMDNNETMTFPTVFTRETLDSKYAKIPLTASESKLLRRYCLAMAHLYGAIPLQKAWSIIMEQNPNKFTKKQLNAFAKVARHEEDAFVILGNEEVFSDGRYCTPTQRTLYDYVLFGVDEDVFVDIIVAQQGKPYYIPPKKELLNYTKSFYCEPTPQAIALKTYLGEILSSDVRIAKYTFQTMLTRSKLSLKGLQGIFDLLDNFDLTSVQIEKFVKLYQAFHNNLRTPRNLGHTPTEIAKMLPKNERMPTSISFGPGVQKALQDGTVDHAELVQEILNFPNEALRQSMLQLAMKYAPLNIGRNQPCPCGSGKKYKRCCGKKPL